MTDEDIKIRHIVDSILSIPIVLLILSLAANASLIRIKEYQADGLLYRLARGIGGLLMALFSLPGKIYFALFDWIANNKISSIESESATELHMYVWAGIGVAMWLGLNWGNFWLAIGNFFGRTIDVSATAYGYVNGAKYRNKARIAEEELERKRLTAELENTLADIEKLEGKIETREALNTQTS